MGTICNTDPITAMKLVWNVVDTHHPLFAIDLLCTIFRGLFWVRYPKYKLHHVPLRSCIKVGKLRISIYHLNILWTRCAISSTDEMGCPIFHVLVLYSSCLLLIEGIFVCFIYGHNTFVPQMYLGRKNSTIVN